jgi:hypothetical protein
MKKISLLLLLSFVFNNCGKELITIADLPYTTQFEIPVGLNPFTIWELPIYNIPNERLARLSAANVTEDEVERIVGKTGLFSTVFSGTNLDFIQEITVEIFSDNIEDATEILHREQVREDTGEAIGLNASLPDVSRHLEGETFGIIVTIRPRRSATQNIPVQLDFTLGVL